MTINANFGAPEDPSQQSEELKRAKFIMRQAPYGPAGPEIAIQPPDNLGPKVIVPRHEAPAPHAFPPLTEPCERCVEGDRRGCRRCDGSGYQPTAFGRAVIELVKTHFDVRTWDELRDMD